MSLLIEQYNMVHVAFGPETAFKRVLEPHLNKGSLSVTAAIELIRVAALARSQDRP